MARVKVRITFDPPTGVEDVAAQMRSQTIKQIAEETVQRVQARVNHPAADSLRAVATNQWSATIAGSRGGPGIIRPVNAKALRFDPGGGFIFRKFVMGKGLGPLIEAEGMRVDSINTSEIHIK